MTITSSTAALAIALAVGLAPVTAAAAGTPDQSCRAAKLKAAGKYAAALAGCYSKAELDNSAPDAECLSKAAAKVADAFSKADTKGDASCNGLDSTSTAVVVDLVADLMAAAPSTTGGKCPSSIYKAGGKLASSELGAWSKFVTGSDAAKRDEAIGKALTKLSSAVIKAEEKDGCTATAQGSAVTQAVEDGIAPLLDCLAGTGSCTEEEVDAGETVTTDPDGDGPDASEPVTASVETPVAGEVSLRAVDPGSTPPVGYSILGQEVEVTAPNASVASPLVLTFTVDSSLLPPDPFTVQIARNGVLIADCTGAVGTASPDPCVESRTLVAGGDLEIVTLSSHASTYSILTATGPTTTVTTTTTTTMEPPAPGYWMRWQVRADQTGNDRATEIDIGWAGGTHDIDPVDGSAVRFGLDCPSATPPTSYGACTVTGFDPSENNCRCANNTATICDSPQAADADDCGGAMCNCYTRPPMPAVVSGTSVCLYGVASSDASGTWNPDTGAGAVTMNEYMKLHIGMSIEQPCPVCIGDSTANDGTRGGTCSGGQTPGAACDANGTDATYPLPAGGGAASLDCLPSAASNISGIGMKFPHVETTASVSLPSGIPCVGNTGENCPCAACSSDTSVGCASDAECLAALGRGCNLDPFESCTTNADCAAVNEGNCNQTFHFCQGASAVACTTNADCTSANVGPCVAPSCNAKGQGATAQPNGCATTCTVGGDGDASCDGPINRYCDGYTEEDGKGILACSTNTDCTSYDPSWGACSIDIARECFPPTIADTGVADSDSPRTVAALCSGPTSNGPANDVSGLPGPVRLRTDWSVTYGE